jgi:YD repeat-containing protein
MRSDRQKNGLRGSVESVRVEVAEFKEEDGQLVEKPWYGYTLRFNPKGNVVEHVHHNPDGSAWRTINDYSEAGKIIATRNYDASGQLTHEVRYVYDEQGRLVAEQIVSPDGMTNTPVIYVYDVEGRRTKIETLNFDGETGLMIGIEDTNTSIAARDAKRIETRYDVQGAAIEVLAYNSEGALVTRVEITRDAHGNPLEETQYLGDVVSFEPCSTDACSAEEQAPLTEEQQAELAAEMARVFAPGAPMSVHTHSYDERGLLVESSLRMMGMQASRQTFAYDEAGNKVEEAQYEEDGSLQSKAIFTRKVDERGNWTEEIVSSASSWDAEFGLSTPQHITRRVITYY